MKIHEYNEMMAYLTRPSYVSGGRVGYEAAGFVKPATEEVRKLAIEKFGIPFEELDTQRRSRLRTGRYSERPPGHPRAPTLPEHEKIAQKLYNKSFDELTSDQRHRIRVGRTTIESGKRPLDLMSSAERVKFSRERLKKFVDAFKKENKRLPFLEEIRSQGNFDYETIKKAEAEGIVKIGKAEGLWKYAKTKKVDQDVLKLSKNEKILNAVKKGEFPDLSDVSRALKVDKNIAANRVYQLASALAGDREIEGFNIRSKKGPLKLLDNPQGYAYQLRRLAELKIGKATGENITAARKRAISNYPDKELGLKYSIDEPAGIISSAKRGTAPYGIFSQVIDREINKKLKYSFDSRKSIAEKKLQNVIATGNKQEINKEVKKFNQMVSDYEKNLNKGLKPNQKKIKLFKVSLASPEETIANFDKLSDQAKKAFKDNYKTRGYSFKVPSDIKPLSTIAQDLKNPKIAADISRRAALGEARLYSFPAMLENPKFLAKEAMQGAKLVGKGLGKTASSLITPTGAAAIWGATGGFDPKSGIDRAGLAAEAAFAPELVRWTEKLTKPIKNQALRSGVQRGLNLFMNPTTAMRAAKIVSPLGWAALAGEGAYQGGKFMYRDYQKRKAAVEKMWREDPEEMNRLALEVSETMRDDTSTMFNQGGRVGFAKGPKDPSKRVFLKGVAMASMIPIIGKYFKLAQPATKAAAQYTGPILEGLGNKLKWVQLLAKRLWNEGEDVTEKVATVERQIVKRGTLESGDEVDMIYDVNTKDVHFEVAAKEGSGYGSASGAYEQSYQLGYRAPQVIEEGVDAGKKIKSEVDVVESRPRQVSPEDVELDADVSSIDDALSDLTELEAFAKKKTVKEIHKIKGTKPKDTVPDWDPPDYDWDDVIDPSDYD